MASANGIPRLPGTEGSDSVRSIRAAVLAGIPLIVVDRRPAVTLGILREAMAVAGRRDRLQQINIGVDRPQVPHDLEQVRRVDEAELPTEGELRVIRALLYSRGGGTQCLGPLGDRFSPRRPDRTDAAVPDPREACRTGPTYGLMDPIPALDIDALAQGGCAHLFYASAGKAFMAWLALKVEDRATAVGTPPPVLVLHRGTDAGIFAAAGWVTARAGDDTTRIFVGSPEALANLPPGICDGEWIALRDAATAGLAYEDVGGYRIARGEGRLVAFPRSFDDVAWADGCNVKGTMLYVDAGGWASAMQVTGSATPDAVRTALARAWLGGLDLFMGRNDRQPPIPGEAMPGGLQSRAVPDPWACILAALYEGEALPGILRDATDVELAKACRAGLDPQPTHRWARESERRRQFALSWPALSSIGPEPGITAAVDAGLPMVPVLATRIGVGRAVVRRLVGARTIGSPSVVRELVRDDHLGRGRNDPRMDVAGFLSHLPVHELPRRGVPGDWDAFEECLEATTRIVDFFVYHETGFSPEDVRHVIRLALQLPGRDWAERCEALVGVIPNGRSPHGVTDFHDAMESLGEWTDAVSGGEFTRDGLIDFIADGRSAVGIAEASARWHEDPILREWGRLSPDTRWPVPFDPQELGDGWSIAALQDVRSLVEEGGTGPDPSGMDGLDHCVGGYGARCLDGSSVILSLRRRDGDGVVRRDSTVQLVRTAGGTIPLPDGDYGLAQHRARANAEPSPQAEKVLREFLDRLQGNMVPGPSDPFVPGPPATRDDQAAMAAALLPRWRRVFPARHARIDLQGILALLGGGRDA